MVLFSKDRSVKYNNEYERKLRIAHIGCGGHSFRNIFPTYQYAPVDLVAVCDLNKEKADYCARQFGAKASYTDYRKMIEEQRPDAVFVITNYDSDGTPHATRIAIESLKMGCHVWMEKPPASSVAQIEEMMEAAKAGGKKVLIGFKKMFFPGVEKIKEIIERKEEFGNITSIYVRYPQNIPPFDKRDGASMVPFLDHIVHPGSIIRYLMGDIESLCYYEERIKGSTMGLLKFKNGAIGTLHLCGPISGNSPLEMLEVVGEGANVVLNNNIKLTYYRRGSRGYYGRGINFTCKDENAPLYWEPEFSLGCLWNNNLFMLGYAQEVIYFCECILDDKPIEKANLEDAHALMRLFEAYKYNPPGTIINF